MVVVPDKFARTRPFFASVTGTKGQKGSNSLHQ